jgi:hypothetical protein
VDRSQVVAAESPEVGVAKMGSRTTERFTSDKHTFPGVPRGLINLAIQTFFSKIKHKISRIVIFFFESL